jgi:hypothetical protein
MLLRRSQDQESTVKRMMPTPTECRSQSIHSHAHQGAPCTVYMWARKTKSVCAPPPGARRTPSGTTYALATDPRSTVTVHAGPTPPRCRVSRVGHRPPGAVTVGALTKSYSRLQRAGAATIQFPNIAVTVGLGLINMKNSRPRTGRPSSELGVKDPRRAPLDDTRCIARTQCRIALSMSPIYTPGHLHDHEPQHAIASSGTRPPCDWGCHQGQPRSHSQPVTYWRQREQPRY